MHLRRMDVESIWNLLVLEIRMMALIGIDGKKK